MLAVTPSAWLGMSSHKSTQKLYLPVTTSLNKHVSILFAADLSYCTSEARDDVHLISLYTRTYSKSGVPTLLIHVCEQGPVVDFAG
jgi:hypothetical protein